jgi:peptide chain release factor 1
MSDNTIIRKLEGIRHKFEEIGQQITDPAVMADMKRFVSLNKEYRSLEPVVAAYEKYKNVLSNIESSKQILSTEKDEELREMAKMEVDTLTQEHKKVLRKKLKCCYSLPIPRIPRMR